MRVFPRVVAALATAAVLAAGSAAGAAAPEEEPLPVGKQAILRKEGATYFVEGRQKVAAGIELAIQKDVKIVGRGKDAVLEVEGELQVHGVKDREVVFENVTIELAPKFTEIHIDMCKFRGGGIRTAQEKASVGRLFIENSYFEGSAVLDVVWAGDNIDLQRIWSDRPVRVRGVVPEGATRNTVKLMVMNCCPMPQGSFVLNGGLVVEGIADVTVRTNLLRGPPTVFKNCPVVIFDANKVESAGVEFRQDRPGCFGQTKIQKCDMYTTKVLAWSPRNEKDMETIPVDKCWFKGETDRKKLLSTVFNDADDDPTSGVRFNLLKVMDRPLELAGSLNR